MKSLKLTVCVVPILLFCNALYAQKIENIRAEMQGKEVVVTYDLITSSQNQKFDIQLFSSINEFKAPHTSVRGDVGDNVSAGVQKRIVWTPGNEFERFDGNVTFEIQARALALPITFDNPKDGTSFKRGKVYQVKWSGLESSSNVDLQLIKSGIKLRTIGNVSTAEDFTWTVPMETKPGGDYQIKLVTGNNKKSATSGIFKISRKIPLALKIAPVLVIGGVAAALLGGSSGGGGGDGGGGGGGVEPTTLPNPPEPGG